MSIISIFRSEVACIQLDFIFFSKRCYVKITSIASTTATWCCAPVMFFLKQKLELVVRDVGIESTMKIRIVGFLQSKKLFPQQSHPPSNQLFNREKSSHRLSLIVDITAGKCVLKKVCSYICRKFL